jgi:hypothetical protein
MGNKSKQEVDISSAIIGTVSQTNYTDCATYSDGTNEMIISGDNNLVSGVDQKITIDIDHDCVMKDPLNYSFSSRISNGVVQNLSSEQVAMTQWMDNSKDDNTVKISNDISMYVSQENSQDCENDISAHNTLIVSGSSNVIKDICQAYTADTVTNCLMKDGLTFNASNDVTDRLNQSLEYISVNPFAFITDAIIAIADSIVMLVAFCFIVFLCFIALFAVLRHRGKSKRRAAAVAQGIPAASIH